MEYAPIVLFTYNRLLHTQRTIDSLQKNFLASRSKLFIFSDGGKNKEDIMKVDEVRKYIRGISGFENIQIIENKFNKGLANSIIEGVTQVVNKYKKIIVLEDDMITSRYFLNYMNDALELYESDEKVGCISGYIYPIKKLPETFFVRGSDCWGWATWKRSWNLFEKDGEKLLKEICDNHLEEEFNFNNSYPYVQMLNDQIAGRNNSWAIRWYASIFLKNKLCLYPQKSFVHNIGNDGSGTHCGISHEYGVSLVDEYRKIQKIEVYPHKKARKQMESYYKGKNNMYQKRKLLTRFFNFFSKSKTKHYMKKYGFFGDYHSWDEAIKQCNGYGAENILQKTLESTLKVKNGKAVFERDSCIFDTIQYSCGLLASLLKVAVENDNSLRVLDFGGALGSHYFQNKSFLHPIDIKRWTVVEQKHYVDIGKEKIADEILDFEYSIDDVPNANVLILSCVIQYLPAPYEWLEKFIQKQIPFIILDRTAFSTEGRDRLTLQKVPPEIYEAVYPAWFLDKNKLLSSIAKRYELLAEFDDTIDVITDVPCEYKGFLFRFRGERCLKD